MLRRNGRIFVLSVLVWAVFMIYAAGLVPDDMYFMRDEPLEIKSLPMIELVPQSEGQSRAASGGAQQLTYTAKLFGVLPVKTVNVSVTDQRMVMVAGTPFGVKMFSDGVMVVGFSDIETPMGNICPAKNAGLQLGDVITKLDGEKVQSNTDVQRHINRKGNSIVKVTFVRDGLELEIKLVPVKEESGGYRTGMWVRDSSAGVGTMTFCDVNKGMFAGLGHGIKDTDTQKDIPLLSGEIVPVKITGYTPSSNGEAGELKGSFISEFPIGRVWANSANGVYGSIFSLPDGKMMEVASPAQVQTGAATMLTTIDGTKPKEYDIVIEKISLTGSNQAKNMVIRVTDAELLEKTGGIVQGMSGSPIVQNGRLVGAVTHVFINQVNRGYAVFAQNMVQSMDDAQKLYQSKAG